MKLPHHKLSPNYFPEQLRTELKHVSDTSLLRMESECRSGSTKARPRPWLHQKESLNNEQRKNGVKLGTERERAKLLKGKQVREQSLGEEREMEVREGN